MKILKKNPLLKEGGDAIQFWLFLYWCAVLSCSVVSDSATPWDYSPPGSSVGGILQARRLEWVAMPFSTYYVCTCVCVYVYIYIYTGSGLPIISFLCACIETWFLDFKVFPWEAAKRFLLQFRVLLRGSTPVIQWSFSWSVFFSTWIWSKLWLESWSKAEWWKTTSGTTRLLLLIVKSLHWRSVEGGKKAVSSLKVVTMTATADYVWLLIMNLLIVILHRHCTEFIYMY